MKNIKKFLSENFHFLVVKFSIYLNRRVFVMDLNNVERDVKHQIIIRSQPSLLVLY